MTKTYAIASNFNDMLFELEDLSKKYDLSTGAKRYLKDGLIRADDPYFRRKNDRWEIRICSITSDPTSGYICVRPYSEKCKDYLEKSAKLKGNYEFD